MGCATLRDSDHKTKVWPTETVVNVQASGAFVLVVLAVKLQLCT